MSKISKTYMLLFGIIISAQAQVNLSLSTGVVFFDPDLNYTDASLFGAALFYNLNNKSSIGFDFQTDNSSIQTQTPSGTKTVSLNLSSFKILYQHLLVKNIFSLDLEPALSFGIQNIYRPAYSIDLGAIGNKRIPSTQSSFFTFSVAMRIVKNLSKRLGFFAKPVYAFF